MFGISYWIIPVFSGFVWLGTLLGMLLFWTVHQGSPYITPMREGQHIAYISDIGAHQMQPLFIAGGTVTVVSFTTVFILERWLRHSGRLHHNTSWVQKSLSILAIIFAVAGMIGLIILTCKNDVKYSNTHDICLGIFIGGYILSAIFICWEYQRLGIHYRQYRLLAASFWIKLAFIFIELGIAIAFGVCGHKKNYNAAAICEWVVALIYAFYVWSFALDFIPAVKTKHHESQETELEAATATAMEEQDGFAGSGFERAYPNGRVANGVHYQNESQSNLEPSRNF